MYYTGRILATEDLLQYARSICNAFDPYLFLNYQNSLKKNQADYVVPCPNLPTVILDSNEIIASDLQTLRKNIPLIKQSHSILLPYVVSKELTELSFKKLEYIRENSTEIYAHRTFYQESMRYNLHTADAIILGISRLHDSTLISRDLQMQEAAHLHNVTIYQNLHDFLHRDENTKHFN